MRGVRRVTRQPFRTRADESFSAWRSAPPKTGLNCGQNISTECPSSNALRQFAA